MLYPINNTKRVAISLNGLWNFECVKIDYIPKSPLKNPLLIGVPASYNELFTDTSIRDYVGVVCYERIISIPQLANASEFRIRIGAAGHIAKIYLDGVFVSEHNGHFLPIDFAIPERFIKKGKARLSVVLDNRLSFSTLPIGETFEKNSKLVQSINHDFANETGIHRDVYLYSLPSMPIRDVFIKTKGHEEEAIIYYEIVTDAINILSEVISPSGEIMAKGTGKSGQLFILNPVLWDIGQGNLYTFRIQTENDLYEESFGIRDIEIKGTEFLLNGKPVYFKGFGMHEDHITLGKASNTALNIRDFNLLKWMNANSFRTSHYPYAEQMYDLADRFGFLVIDEIPAVGLNFWSSREVFKEGSVDNRTLETHKAQLTELIERDKNHPSVVMISVANEANTYELGALPYFEQVFAHIRSITDLPITIVENVGAKDNKVAQLADVIGLNRYAGWYTDFSDTSVIHEQLNDQLNQYYQKFKKPMILTEFGADTIAGLHKLPAVAFSEEFQVEFLKEYQSVLKKLPFVIGEHVWNFADFLTKQGLTRMDGNKKGVFTRDRQPKMAAHWLKEQWK